MFENARAIRAIIIIIIGVVMIIVSSIMRRRRRFTATKLHQKYMSRLFELIVILVIAVNLVILLDPTINMTRTVLSASALIVAILGFAAQTAISDIICGLLIISNKPFEVGDRIIVEGLEPGIVEDITLRHTVLKIYDGFRIIVPNSQINQKTLINASYKDAEKRGIHLKYSVSYDTDVQKAMDAIRDSVAESPYTLKVINHGINEDSGTVYFLEFAESALVLETTIWVTRSTSSYIAVTDVNMRVNKTFRERGIEIPYSYLNVIGFNGDEQSSVEKETESKESDRPKKKKLSERHFRTNNVTLRADGSNLSHASSVLDSFAKRQGFNGHEKSQLEHITEEAVVIIGSIVGNVNTRFWIEGSGVTYRVHVGFNASVDSDAYKSLISLSSSGRNEAVNGITKRLWEIITVGITSTQKDDRSDSRYEWSLTGSTEDGDEEIARSILASISDDIRVSVTREHVEFIITKTNQR